MQHKLMVIRAWKVKDRQKILSRGKRPIFARSRECRRIELLLSEVKAEAQVQFPGSFPVTPVTRHFVQTVSCA